MKRIRVFTIIFVITMILVSCSSCKKHGVADDLVQYLNERDTEEIKNLFSEYVRSSVVLVNQIDVIFDLLGDKTITSYDWTLGASQGSYEKGKKTWEVKTYFIENIEWSDGSDEIETIIFGGVTVDEDNPRYVGVEWIKFKIDEEYYWIGESD